MKFSLKIEIDLTEEEINFLKNKFLPKRGTYNVIFENTRGKSIKVESTAIKTLTEKGVILIDHLANSTLTQIGHKILDSFDRDKKISDLLDGINEVE